MRWKWIIGGVAGLIVIALAVGLIVLSTYDFNDLKPRLAQAVHDKTGRELKFGGDLNLKLGLTPSLVVDDVRLLGRKATDPDLVAVKRLEVEVELLPLLRKRIKVNRLIVIEPKIELVWDERGRPRFGLGRLDRMAKEKHDHDSDAPRLDLGRVMIKDARLVIDNRQTRQIRTLKLTELDLDAAAGPVKFKIRGALDDQPFDLSGQTGSLNRLIASDAAWPVELTGRIKDIPLTLKATLTKSDNNDRLMIALSDLKLTLAESDLGGRIEVYPTASPVKVKAKLESKQLDLRPLLAAAPAGKKVKGPRGDKVFPADPISLPDLKAVEAEVVYKAARLMTPQLIVTDYNSKLVIHKGRLTGGPITGQIAGGKFKSTLDLTPAKQGLAAQLRLKADKIDLARLQKELKRDDKLTGSVDLEIGLTGHGRSVAGLMAGLNGHATLIMGRGQIDNGLIDLVGGELSSGLFRLMTPDKKDDSAQVNCLVVRFDVKSGLAKATALVLDTTQMTTIGQGQIDLRTEGLDISLKPAPKKGLGVSGVGSLGLSLGELTKPFKLGGTLAQPSLALDPTATALAVGKAVGGVALFGPVGIVAALASPGESDENPCLTALKAARTGYRSDGKTGDQKATGQKTDQSSGNVIEDAAQGIGGAVKKLFGN